MPFAGIDIGSTMTKVVIVDHNETILASVIGPTGAEHRHLGLRLADECIKKAGLVFEQLEFIVATGYGRINVPFADKQVTEITCHGRGIRALFPAARTILDVGGQDSKGIKLNAEGKVVNFIMNDKCAAGTGRFLEVIAETLGVRLQDMGALSLTAKKSVAISSICTVFAEHEVTSRLAEGAAIPDIIAGLHAAIAGRAVGLLRNLGIEKEAAFTGGGAKNIGLVRAVEERVGFPVCVAPEPLLTGALGAALLGKDFIGRGVSPDHERRREGITFFK
jgi:(R)-2-hydroxyacyl-CoA dehydratese activating ATPase